VTSCPRQRAPRCGSLHGTPPKRLRLSSVNDMRRIRPYSSAQTHALLALPARSPHHRRRTAGHPALRAAAERGSGMVVSGRPLGPKPLRCRSCRDARHRPGLDLGRGLGRDLGLGRWPIVRQNPVPQRNSVCLTTAEPNRMRQDARASIGFTGRRGPTPARPCRPYARGRARPPRRRALGRWPRMDIRR
jgi:hypothetical protein